MIVLIPAYEPDRRLVELVGRLKHYRVVVVDDGSGPAYAALFARALRLGAELITLDRNQGKGNALKAGFAHALANHPGHDVVCADSDGQHRPEDIDAVADRLATTGADIVLGARRFTGEVPARSRFGNTLTRRAFALATGRPLIDTQTGLRGHPARTLAWLGSIAGDRFEYELRVLLRAAREARRIEEVEIATIYLEHNASSHFRPIRDSARIYGPLLSFAASSLIGFTIDAIVLLVLAGLTGNLALSAVGARLISASANYAMNYAWIFPVGAPRTHRRSGPMRSAWRYAVLAAVMLGANIVLLQSLSALTGSVVVAKLGTELLLFSAGYLVQRHLVFADRLPGKGCVSAGHEQDSPA
ncbi:sugar translocase [Rhizocola hellebori]|uniref:Sugar translocase n=1 Tax=Rhizocola hellebori TaxID=1392758 RepID=A0A8J3QCC9_9ACTN|nr:bifunctional glycosyltransferase family 2/GtrA family protein [Rhizocola hellebori]GIH08223.1 sugar translocase [Rhizocola hellebori]